MITYAETAVNEVYGKE